MAGLFEMGKLKVEQKNINQSDASSPPKPLVIVHPSEEGEYGVVLFFHGFCITSTFYTQLFMHISSYGYIVVAPQIMCACLCNEIQAAVKTANWLASGLQSALALSNLRPNLAKLALAGHSRGGKTAFCVLLDHLKELTVQFSALIGIDPVAGFQLPGLGCNIEIPPNIITNNSDPFDIKVSKLLIGTELGEEAKNCMSPPCAPLGLNHVQFYEKSLAICYHFVANQYGHMDMLNDDLKDLMGKLANCMCKNGKDRAPMRSCVGGLVVAFLKAHVEGQGEDLATILGNPGIAPVPLDAEAKLS